MIRLEETNIETGQTSEEALNVGSITRLGGGWAINPEPVNLKAIRNSYYNIRETTTIYLILIVYITWYRKCSSANILISALETNSNILWNFNHLFIYLIPIKI